MFTKRNLVDIKKSTSKLQDSKKDVATRVKHLKIILENVDIAEAKGLFEANFSHIYNVLYESFVQTETNLRQRELSFHLVHKAHKEELECTLWILEQVLCLLPELIHRRWQLHSLGRMLGKLLHLGNSIKLRRQGIRYFLMWYQALNENAPQYVHHIFASIVPGFYPPAPPYNPPLSPPDPNQPVAPAELLPLLPPSSGERPPDHPGRFYLDALLEYMVHTTVKLEWQDKGAYHHRCFNFLLEKFKTYYLPKICPNFCQETSLYRPNLELPVMRRLESENEAVHCRVSLIMWVTNYMHQAKKNNEGGGVGPPQNQQVQPIPQQQPYHSTHEDESHDSAHPSLDSTISIQTNKTTTDEELAAQIVREVLCSTRDNVDFIHELYRQAFLLNFTHVIAIRKIIAVYKDLIQGNVLEIPPYALELPEDMQRNPSDELNPESARPGRLRNDSYLGAIHKENLLVRAGMQNVYQLFMTHAANVFLLEINSHVPRMLEEQTDACKRILNIYRYMVMNTRMDNNTWEQLLLVLLQITSLVLGENPPKKKASSLGGKLAPAIFQTLIVTWIKANLNVMISRELWDRFLHVLTSLTNWEELIKEWAKTLETLTRVLARHVYNLDLTDLPLDRLNEKTKRGRKGPMKTENNIPNNSKDCQHSAVCRQDSSLPDGYYLSKRSRAAIPRSYSETSLTLKRRSTFVKQEVVNNKNRRSRSLETLCAAAGAASQHDADSADRTRSPSPAPSSGLESTSVKDSPMQLDVLAGGGGGGGGGDGQQDSDRGVVCGGTVRGWLPDVAVILWRRMLGALGDVNQISDPKLHAQVFEYLVKLTDTLIKISQNQGVSPDNMSTPQAPELVPPLTLLLPWCFGALTLPDTYEVGKLSALRLLCTITLNCDAKHRTYLPKFYWFLHSALTGPSKSAYNTCLKYLGPRFLSLQLPGSSLLLLDLIHACNTVLNSTEKLESTPRTEAVSILANLLTEPEDLSSISVLQPDQDLHAMMCPDIKEHVVSILLRTGKREPKGKARCIALSALGVFVYKELNNQTFHPKVADAINVLLLALKFTNKTIVQLTTDILFLLCDHAALLWQQYPRLGGGIVRALCATLAAHSSDRPLSAALLLCLGEWCMRLGPARLMEAEEYVAGGTKATCLLLRVFSVLHDIIVGFPIPTKSKTDPASSNNNSVEDFDLDIQQDDLGGRPSSKGNGKDAAVLCARTVLAHLVTHLGHFPMAIGAARLSSLVAEHDDVPDLSADELSTSIFNAPNIQLFILSKDVIASLIELPTLDLPGGGVTAGLSTADRQVRVLLRDLSGKSCWDASVLYRTPESVPREKNEQDNAQEIDAAFITLRSNLSSAQPESLMVGVTHLHALPQRAMRHRPPNVLPDISNAAPDMDQLDDLLQYIGHTSPECLENMSRKLNEPAPAPMSSDLENEAIASVISQRNVESEDNRLAQLTDQIPIKPASRPCSRADAKSVTSDSMNYQQQSLSNTTSQNAFQLCRLFFSQLGFAGWERRQQLHLLNKTERLLRELRNLDNQGCRETHKFAVIYVAPGQEDKNSILSNQGGSAAYEQFLSALAWEVELEAHTGFLGGLQRQGSTGLTAPYIATSFLEAVFHVATRMPSDTPEAVLNKIRHLGNDEVHIVWSEHNRDYRRDIIPTEFCDILIAIYPLGNNLNRVTVNCKADVPHFGVLFNEAIVASNVLAGLVRATAICASRAKRMTYQYYQQYYEERARSLETVVTKHKHSSTYEEFIARVYSPVSGLGGVFRGGGQQMSGNTTESATSGSGNSSLANALLDSSHSHKVQQRSGDNKFRANEAVRTSWFNTSEVQNVESSISPRPMKRITSNLKNPRKSLKHETSVESPPESPQQTTRKK